MSAGLDEVLPVAVRGLVKRYGHIVAVSHVDLTVHAGDVYGFLGPNGAGKTTAMRMLLGLLRPDAGNVSLFGATPSEKCQLRSTALQASSRHRTSTRI